MLGRKQLMLTVMASAVGLMASSAFAQEAAEPAEGLPEVEVIQQKKAPAKAAKKKAAPVQAASPAPQPPPSDVEYADETPALDNSAYGASASGGAASRAASGPLSPVSAKTMLPQDLQNFAGSGSRVSTEDLEAQRPLSSHEALARVPGVVTVTDDGIGRHGGIGIRGSTYRRSRKVLVLEDGQPINFATYLDSSVHHTPPIERVESIEVMRGPIVNYGPLNNHGVVNFRNLSPFGANETVIKAGIGTTEGADKSVNNFRHVHTRQNIGNAGIVASYSGTDVGGSWDNEVLRYNDFYGSVGLRGTNQDVVISGGFFRQRDSYDEYNFRTTHGKAAFYANGRNKGDGGNTNFTSNPIVGLDDNVYEANHYRLQIAHNLYIDQDTTLSTRLYGADNHRVRSYFRDDAVNNLAPTEMDGRDRRYKNYGIDSRLELANRQIFPGILTDFQFGVRYEEQDFANINRRAPHLSINNKGTGPVREQAQLDAESFAAFAQAAVHLTPTLTVTPGVRLETYDVKFKSVVSGVAGGVVVPGTARFDSDHTHVLPSIGFAWEAFPRSTFYGGYHRGLTPHIVRDANVNPNSWPLDEEIGDNFELGFRTTAVRGVTLDMAYFHNRIDDYQYREAFRDPISAAAVYSSLSEVSINGFEIYGRLDSNPFTGGPWNVFGEAVYTYADAEIERGVDNIGTSAAPVLIDASGNQAPESMKHFANLTLGVEYRELWDASVTYTYRDSFFMDARNSFTNETDSEWLLSARANLHVTDGLTLWASGQNLTDEFYISEVSGGYKPGLGRTVMGGFTYKFD